MDNGVFNTILDRTAGKVKDELNLSTSQFAELTDEQLELLAAHEAAKQKKESDNNGSSE